MTHIKELTDYYLGSVDLKGQTITLTVKNVEGVEIFNKSGKGKEKKAVINWKEKDAKPWILNKTNAALISEITGTPFVENWGGTKVTLKSERVRGFGGMTDGLRVQKTMAKSEPIICENCNSEIQPFGNYTAEQVAQINLKNHGKKLCAKCSKELKKEQNNENNEN